MMGIIVGQREVKTLYKQFLRLHKKFPVQEHRSTRFSEFLLNQIRYQFRNTTKVDIDLGKRELDALAKIVQLNDNLLTSPFRSYLPPKEQYELLDTVAQNVIKHPAGAMNYFESFIRGIADRSK